MRSFRSGIITTQKFKVINQTITPSHTYVQIHAKFKVLNIQKFKVLNIQKFKVLNFKKIKIIQHTYTR